MADTPETGGGGPMAKLTVDPERAGGEYANFVSIAHTFTEVVLDFARMMPGRSELPVVSRVIMTPVHARQLVAALQHNLKRYEQQYGPIPTPPKTPTPEPGAN